VRRMYTTRELHRLGLSKDAIGWAVRKGRLSPVIRGVFGEGPLPPTALEKAVAVVVATNGTASGPVAAALLQIDGVDVTAPDVSVRPSQGNHRKGVRRRELPPEQVVVVDGVRCTSPLRTLVDLAALVDDTVWEQALECVLRRKWATVKDVEHAACGKSPGAVRMRRVLALRPQGAPPTESLLETLMVQLARRVPGLPPPERQYEVRDRSGAVRARLDLAWPELGLFVELDGEHHRAQRVSDRQRETEVVAMTGWLCGRFTWEDVTRRPNMTVARLTALARQAALRPPAHAEAGQSGRGGGAT